MAEPSSISANGNTNIMATGTETAVPMSPPDPLAIPDRSFTKRAHSKPYPFISPHRPELSTAGLNVVVTGGGTGIGKAIATAYARAGAKSITIMGRRHEKLVAAVVDILAAAVKPEATRVLPVSVDLTNAQSVKDALRDIVIEVGPVDILVSNAAGMPARGQVVDTPPELLLDNFGQNVISTLNILSTLSRLPRPLHGRRPVIIHVSSAMCHIPPLPLGAATYAVTKSAALKLVHYFAAENPDFHVVSLHPGIVQTAMTTSEVSNGSLPMDEADLPGHFCVWLASPEAEFLRDKFVWTNWDAEELVARKHEILNSDLLTVALRT